MHCHLRRSLYPGYDPRGHSRIGRAPFSLIPSKVTPLPEPGSSLAKHRLDDIDQPRQNEADSRIIKLWARSADVTPQYFPAHCRYNAQGWRWVQRARHCQRRRAAVPSMRHAQHRLNGITTPHTKETAPHTLRFSVRPASAIAQYAPASSAFDARGHSRPGKAQFSLIPSRALPLPEPGSSPCRNLATTLANPWRPWPGWRWHTTQTTASITPLQRGSWPPPSTQPNHASASNGRVVTDARQGRPWFCAGAAQRTPRPPTIVPKGFTDVAAQSLPRIVQASHRISPRRQARSPLCEVGDALLQPDAICVTVCPCAGPALLRTTPVPTKSPHNDACRVPAHLCALLHTRYSARLAQDQHWTPRTVSSTPLCSATLTTLEVIQ